MSEDGNGRGFLPARTGRMKMIFIHVPCKAEIGFPTRAPVRVGMTCVKCDPEFMRPALTDWRIVMKDDPDAAEIIARWA